MCWSLASAAAYRGRSLQGSPVAPHRTPEAQRAAVVSALLEGRGWDYWVGVTF